MPSQQKVQRSQPEPEGIASPMRASAAMSIVELARRTGTDIVSIRSYEEKGLFPEQRRSLGGKFGYHHEHVERLHFIAQSTGRGILARHFERPDRWQGRIADVQ